MNGGVARWSDRYGGGVGGSVSEEQVRSVELEIPLRLSRRWPREWSVHTQRR